MATISKRRRTKLRSWLCFRYRGETNLLIPELVKIEAKQTLLIRHLRKIEAKRILFIPQIGKIKAEGTLFIPQIGQIEAKRSLFIPQIRKNEAERTLFIPEIDKIEANKNELNQSKTNTGGIFKTFVEPRNRFQEKLILPAYALAGLYNNPIPALFLAPLDCSKAP